MKPLLLFLLVGQIAQATPPSEIELLHFPHAKLAAALPAAMQWQRTRILANGEVSVEGNSRTGVGKETYLSQPKNVNTNEVVLALAFWGATQGDDRALAEAGRVFDFARESRRTPAVRKP